MVGLVAIFPTMLGGGGVARSGCEDGKVFFHLSEGHMRRSIGRLAVRSGGMLMTLALVACGGAPDLSVPEGFAGAVHVLEDAQCAVSIAGEPMPVAQSACSVEDVMGVIASVELQETPCGRLKLDRGSAVGPYLCAAGCDVVTAPSEGCPMSRSEIGWAVIDHR